MVFCISFKSNFNKDYFPRIDDAFDPCLVLIKLPLALLSMSFRENEAKAALGGNVRHVSSSRIGFQGTYGILPHRVGRRTSRITGTDHIDVAIGEVIPDIWHYTRILQGSRSGLRRCSRFQVSLCHGHAKQHGWILHSCFAHRINVCKFSTRCGMLKNLSWTYPTVDFAGIGNESILQKGIELYNLLPLALYDSQFLLILLIPYPCVSYLPVSRNAGISYKGFFNPLAY